MRRICLLTGLATLTLCLGCAEKAVTEASPAVQAPSFVRTSEQPASDAPPAPPAMRGFPINDRRPHQPGNAADGWIDKADAQGTKLANPNDTSEALADLPNVTVKNIGLHIGGGPNTRVAKRPIRDAVKPHYDDLLRCYAKAHHPRDKATYGVDIRIPADGGKARISNPRTSLRGTGLRGCMQAVFKKVFFPEPPRGKTTVVSFSVRFTRND